MGPVSPVLPVMDSSTIVGLVTSAQSRGPEIPVLRRNARRRLGSCGGNRVEVRQGSGEG